VLAVLANRDGNPLSRIAKPSPVIRQYSRVSHFQLKSLFQIDVSNQCCFKSTRRKEVCQKLVRSSVMAAEPLAAKN